MTGLVEELEYIVGGPRLVAGVAIEAVLEREMRKLRAQRALILCGQRAGQTPEMRKLRETMGARVLVHDRIASHTPIETLEEALPIARKFSPDCIVTVGGGSVQDAGKLVALMLAEGVQLESFRVQWTDSRELEIPTLEKQKLPIIAAPCTLSAAEVIGAATFVTESNRYVIVDPGIAPAVVLYDPYLAASTPMDIFLGTGVNAVAHCIEAAYSRRKNPISEALAVGALRLLVTSLPDLRRDPKNTESRKRAQIGAYMSGLAYSNAWLGVAHSLCQALGARYRVQQGLLHAIVLPHALRFNSPAVMAEFKMLNAAIDGLIEDNDGSSDFVDTIFAFVERLKLPRRLRDLGVPQNEIPAVARDTFLIWHTHFNPRRVNSPDELEAVLDAAW